MFKRSNEALILLIGDVACFYVALFVTLFLRYQVIPSGQVLSIHAVPFTMLFAVWLVVHYIAGLYEKQTLILKDKLPGMILNTQIVNSFIAVLFFYFLPIFQIAPKTNLFLDLVLSFVLVLYWRNRSHDLFRARHREDALLVASGTELAELEREVNGNPRYGFRFAECLDLDLIGAEEAARRVKEAMERRSVAAIVADFDNPKLEGLMSDFYHMLLSNVRLIQMRDVYESIFDRIPLSIVSHAWFFDNVSTAPKRVYDALKRTMDVVLGSVLLVISLPFNLAAAALIKLDDGGPVLIVQERVGQNGRPVRIYKFRSMSRNEQDLSKSGDNRITRVGSFLRKSRIDEFPQFWNVVRGDLSLVGPRPELPSGVRTYEREVPYYGIRHLLKPGLSGWAQLYQENHPHHGEDVEATREKLSYDLYYVKNRSFALDLKIALRTIVALLSRTGR